MARTTTVNGKPRPPGTLGFMINDRLVMMVILINTAAIITETFPGLRPDVLWTVRSVDYACTVYFLVELTIKLKLFGLRGYWQEGWNRFDFIIIVFSLPHLLTPLLVGTEMFAAILPLRMFRLFRFLRLLAFVPDAANIWHGLRRALKASVGVILVLLLLNTVFALGACMLFRDEAPQYFGDPLTALYSMFKIFTLEGWFEIPDHIAEQTDSPAWAIFARCYFVVAVLVGGVFGLSLANAVFVDEMTLDNTRKVEEMVRQVQAQVDALSAQLDHDRHTDQERLRELHADIQEAVRELREASSPDRE